MRSSSWNKFTAASSALAAAGVLTCAVAVLDALVPKASPAAFVASVAVLGLVVTGVTLGYNWACEKCESHFNGRLDRLLSIGMPGRNAASVVRPATRGPKIKFNIPFEKEQNQWT